MATLSLGNFDRTMPRTQGAEPARPVTIAGDRVAVSVFACDMCGRAV
jgi:hypothetical protein